jgi:endo-1,4-beta-D-glucanase Y
MYNELKAKALSRGRRARLPAFLSCALSLAACLSPKADDSDVTPFVPSALVPSPVAPSAVAPAPSAPVAGGGETSPAPTSLEQPEPALPPAPAPEAPLSPEEQAQLAGFGGLVPPTAWNVPVSSQITETTVARAYLDWKSRFYLTCDDGTPYVLKDDYTGSKQVVSEGIAYGMLLSVGIGDREVFDGLWQFYENHRNGNGLMNWRYDVCGGQSGDNGASDADLDAAMSLVLAESRWGGYADDARDLINAIGDNETQTCGDGHMVLKAGDSYGGCDGRVNPSYFSPAYYRRFAELVPESADKWNKLTDDTYTMLSGFQDQTDGLLPDWGNGGGQAESGDSGQYGYEAVRAPFRIALDLGWSNSDQARGVLQRMSQTIDARGGLKAMADDDSFEDKRNSAFLGSLSLSGVAVSQAKFDGYVSEWKAYEADLDDTWYYQATLRVMFLMAAGGFLPASF